MRKKAIYAGTFDPLTYGHLDLIERSAEIFGHVILAVAQGSLKETLFTVQERVKMINAVVKNMKNVEVVHFDGLLIKYAKERGVGVLIRGIRAYSDFEYEFQMALTNRKLDSAIETLFMMPKETHSYVSSSTVKEVASLCGDIRDFVPGPVARALRSKYKCKSK